MSKVYFIEVTIVEHFFLNWTITWIFSILLTVTNTFGWISVWKRLLYHLRHNLCPCS